MKKLEGFKARAIRPLAAIGAGVAGSGVASAQTFNIPAMGKLNNITGDVSTLLGGNLLDLVVNLGVLSIFVAIVAFFTDMFGFRTGIMRKLGR